MRHWGGTELFVLRLADDAERAHFVRLHRFADAAQSGAGNACLVHGPQPVLARSLRESIADNRCR
jgi:hypothetical protein